MRVNIIILGLILLLPFQLSSQEEEKVRISGIVFHQETKKPLGFVQLVSYQTLLSYASDEDGTFLLSLPETDSIKIISMGFEGEVKTVREFQKTKGTDTIYLKPLSYMLNEVTVNATENQIHLNLPGNIGRNVNPEEEPQEFIPQPSIGMIASPLSLAQSVFSRKSKNQRRLRKTIDERKGKDLWHKALSSGLIHDWIEIADKDLDNFIIYCNSRIKVTANDNLITIRGKVLHLWSQYKKKNE